MREARAWLTGQFFPQTAEEFFAVANARSSQENAWYRQVTSYWEMAAALVLHGALNAELFVDCNNEPFFIYAKFLPLLPRSGRRCRDFSPRWARWWMDRPQRKLKWTGRQRMWRLCLARLPQRQGSNRTGNSLPREWDIPAPHL